MMGQGSGGQKKLFYSFNLDDHVPADHLLRGIDRCLDLGELRRHLAPFYSDTGRPSIDPELMVRMLIVGYSFGIRSERRLCEEVHSVWRIAGSVAWASRMRCLTIRRSRRTGMAASVRAKRFGMCLRVWLSGV
jgi:hypothetical protein